MARFKQVTFYIDRSTFSLGSVCYVNYEYYIAFDPDEISNEVKYKISVEIWGDDVLVEKRLSKIVYDKHHIVAKKGFELSRSFNVPCEILNEKVGEDRLYIVLRMELNGELVDSIRSKQVKDSF